MLCAVCCALFGVRLMLCVVLLFDVCCVFVVVCGALWLYVVCSLFVTCFVECCSLVVACCLLIVACCSLFV